MSKGKRIGVKGSDLWMERVQEGSRVFLDTAPLIYYVEKHPLYATYLKPLFHLIDSGHISAVTSPITLAECLIHPIRRNLTSLQKDFSDLIIGGRNTVFIPIDQMISVKAAKLRAALDLTLADSLQVATALLSECDAILTNDIALRGIKEIQVIILADLTGK